jgi:hypothetical protein
MRFDPNQARKLVLRVALQLPAQNWHFRPKFKAHCSQNMSLHHFELANFLKSVKTLPPMFLQALPSWFFATKRTCPSTVVLALVPVRKARESHFQPIFTPRETKRIENWIFDESTIVNLLFLKKKKKKKGKNWQVLTGKMGVWSPLSPR